MDYGAKRNIVRELQKRGCTGDGPARRPPPRRRFWPPIPDGVMLSNGPGDPAENVYQIEQIRKLLGKVPMFGICLGHQLTALAAGGSTYKLKYGHRGVNQPVRDLDGGRTYITSQNHGYAVDVRHAAKTGQGPLCQRQRRHLRGHRLPGAAGLYGAVPPGGLHRPQGYVIPL